MSARLRGDYLFVAADIYLLFALTGKVKQEKVLRRELIPLLRELMDPSDPFLLFLWVKQSRVDQEYGLQLLTMSTTEKE